MKKILIIDYDQNSLTSLQGTLAGIGYQVVTAADGQSGWDRYNKESPDLVLMEAMLPKVHGFELCQRITSERNSQATVFIMTGVYKDRVYRTEALRTYGASEYFEKPLKMTELLASVEAVLGKPDPRTAAAPAPQPAVAQAAAPPAAMPHPAAAVAAAPEEPRRRERSKADDSIFSLPDDLDRLSKELPKVRKPAPARPETAAEPRFDALADELLKSVLIESSAPKIVKPKPAGGNGNGNGNNGGGAGSDIDRFLKSALAGFDLNKENVKTAKPAPAPTPAATPAKDQPAPPPVKADVPVAKPISPPPAPTPAPTPAKDKPAPAPVKAAVPITKPASPPPAPRPAPVPIPEKPFVVPAPADMKNTLTPGDPGSDVSPFFVPDKNKPAARPVERMEMPKPVAVRHEPERREPAKVEPPAAAPAAVPAADRSEAAVIASAGIFGDIAAPREKKGFPKVLVAVVGVAAVAAAGFFFLKPKPQAPVPTVEPPAVTTTQAEVSPPPVKEEAPAPKPAPKKPQPQAKPADTGAAAILPVETTAPALPLPGGKNAPANGGQAALGSNAAGQEQAPPKVEEAAPPAAKSEADPSQAAPAGTTDAGAAPTATPAPAPVNAGDLVELATVTVQPRLVKRIDPVYPQTAQRVGREGNITVNALIDEKGNVIDTSIVKGIQDDKGLAKAAENAVRKWKFQPALKNGVAVKVWKPFVIVFKAEANPAK